MEETLCPRFFLPAYPYPMLYVQYDFTQDNSIECKIRKGW